MKKIVLSFALLFTLGTLSSQSLQLMTKQGKILSNGDLVYAGGLPDSYMMLELDVQNISDQSRNVLVKKYIRYEAVDSIATFCWGLCFPWFVTQSPDAITIEPGAVSHDFSADYAPGGTLSHTRLGFTFFVADNPNDSISVEVEFAPSWFTFVDKDGNNIAPDQWISVVGPHTQAMSYDLIIKNNSAENKAVQFKRIEKSLVPGSEMFFCWGACFPSNMLQLPEPARLGPGEATDGVSVDYDPMSHSGTSLATYVVWDVDHPEDSLWINFSFDGQAEGIDHITLSQLNIYPNPTTEKFTLSIPHYVSPKSVLYLYNLSGQVIGVYDVNPGHTQEISLRDLPKGTYFISLITAEGLKLADKIVLK
ncbi:MAG: Secretion system C-terminal sorting domain [Bacteroidales bacterium]|nr:Secretion system C-terminal sorting domain [Bacteroidales bacterium]MDN5330128.1 Secretion system C-terminal sorting domain [Bacteroidales bacterium]NLH52840.1 T9SS type A sorting domain-containing protein [Bacteroidales bacterium]NPV35665.1 T9SS type A sorting domain-containing protein [Bacteroidales bacterium]